MGVKEEEKDDRHSPLPTELLLQPHPPRLPLVATVRAEVGEEEEEEEDMVSSSSSSSSSSSVTRHNHTLPLLLSVAPLVTEEGKRRGRMEAEEEGKMKGKGRVRRPSLRLG